MSKRRFALCLAISLLLLGVGGMVVMYQASQSVPDFYQRALVIEPAVAKLAGDELEHEILSARNQFQEGAGWQFVATDEQVNGWLTADLNEKFPELLPKEATNPRVKFDNGLAQIACRVETGGFSTVLSINLEPYLTDHPNEIAIRFHKVRAGSLPIPLSEMLDEISKSGRAAGINVSWTQQDSDPVALVELPMQRDDLRPGVVIRQLNVLNGQIQLAGTADQDQERLAESEDEKINDQR